MIGRKLQYGENEMRCRICDCTFTFGFGIDHETQVGFCPRCDEILSSICEGPEYTMGCIEMAQEQVERLEVMTGDAGDPFVTSTIEDELKLIKHKQRQRKKASCKENRRKTEQQLKEDQKAKLAMNRKFRHQHEAIRREQLRSTDSYRHRDVYASQHEVNTFLQDIVLVTPDPIEFAIIDERDDYTEFYLMVEDLKKTGVFHADTSTDDIIDEIAEAALDLKVSTLQELGNMASLPDWDVVPRNAYPQGYHVVAIAD